MNINAIGGLSFRGSAFLADNPEDFRNSGYFDGIDGGFPYCRDGGYDPFGYNNTPKDNTNINAVSPYYHTSLSSQESAGSGEMNFLA